jgi:putative endonuclease
MTHQGILSKVPVLRYSAMRDGQLYTFWVYIAGSRAGILYTGMTGFLGRRMGQHKTGAFEGFTKKYKCDRLLYYETHSDVYAAKRREKKVALIEKMNPRWEDLAKNWGKKILLRGQSIKKTP